MNHCELDWTGDIRYLCDEMTNTETINMKYMEEKNLTYMSPNSEKILLNLEQTIMDGSGDGWIFDSPMEFLDAPLEPDTIIL